MGLTAAPSSIDDLAAVLAEESTRGRPVVIEGAGCHAGRGGAVASPAVPVRAPSGVVAHEPGDLTATVLGGTTLAELNGVLAAAGQELPVDGLPPKATLGGVLACGLSSRRRLRVGALRDRVLQVKLVTGDGRVVKAGGPTVKNVSGYDLCRLVSGSFGTLGVIAEVMVKVTPRPETSQWYSAPGGWYLADEVRERLYAPAAVEMAGPPWHVQVLLEGHAGDVIDQAARLPEGFQPIAEPPPGDEVFEVTAPPFRLSELVALGGSARAQLGVGIAWLGPDTDPGPVRVGAEAFGGRLHTLRLEPGFDPFGAPPAGLDIMRRIKAAFDPAGILNRGKLTFL